MHKFENVGGARNDTEQVLDGEVGHDKLLELDVFARHGVSGDVALPERRLRSHYSREKRWRWEGGGRLIETKFGFYLHWGR